MDERLFVENREKQLLKELEFFNKAGVGSQVFWKKPEESSDCDFLIPFRREYVGKLIICDISRVGVWGERVVAIYCNDELILNSEHKAQKFSPICFDLES